MNPPETSPHRTQHRPVLLRETLQALELRPGQVVVDGTVGAAGHSSQILPHILPGGRLIGMDRDPAMLARAQARLQSVTSDIELITEWPTIDADLVDAEPLLDAAPAANTPAEEAADMRDGSVGEIDTPAAAASDSISETKLRDTPSATVWLVHASYAELPSLLASRGAEQVDRLLVDLGLSSDQLADADRGFGFKTTGLLDMRFDMSRGEPVAEWLNRAEIAEITNVLTAWGEEPLAREIATAIGAARSQAPLQEVPSLVQLIEQVYARHGKRGEKSHPATRTFQALRIQANAELEHLQRFLTETAPAMLKPGGRIVLISFHSLEDRLIKQALSNREVWEESSRKPGVATPLEIKMNPRSRSAKLRIGIRAE